MKYVTIAADNSQKIVNKDVNLVYEDGSGNSWVLGIKGCPPTRTWGEYFDKQNFISGKKCPASFKDTKVVARNGSPLMVFHGSPRNFTRFNNANIFFSSDPYTAVQFSSDQLGSQWKSKEMTLYCCYLNVKKLAQLKDKHTIAELNIDFFKQNKNSRLKLSRSDLERPEDHLAQNIQKFSNYDGVVWTKMRDATYEVSDIYHVTSPDQVFISRTFHINRYDFDNYKEASKHFYLTKQVETQPKTNKRKL